MSFDNNTNHGRAAKIVEIMEHVEKSAVSNKVETPEIAAMLSPVVDKLRALGVLDVEAPTVPATAETSDSLSPEVAEVPGGRWASDKDPTRTATLHDLAATAPLKELPVVMAVIMNRFDEHVS